MKKLKIAVAITFLAVSTIQISVATASSAVGATSAGLGPEIAAESMTIPPEFSVKLFRGEPDVNAADRFAIDDRGRLWVAENYSYST